MDEQMARDLCARWLRAWRAKDPDEAVGCFEAGGLVDHPRLGTLDMDGLRAHVERMKSAFPDLDFSVDGPVIVADGHVAYRWTMTGTNTGPFMGRAPTGRAIRVEGADFFTCGETAFRHLHELSDTATLLEQLSG